MPKRARSYRAGQLERLKDPAYAAEYINAAIEAGDDAALLLALRNVAEARGVNSVANQAGLSRESVYRMLSEAGNPCYTSLLGILSALGLQFRIQPIGDSPAEVSFSWNSQEESRLLWEINDRPNQDFVQRYADFAFSFRKGGFSVEKHPITPPPEVPELLELVA
jgi:probable addiction module antidote protein